MQTTEEKSEEEEARMKSHRYAIFGPERERRLAELSLFKLLVEKKVKSVSFGRR